MISINIQEEKSTRQDMVYLLRHIANQIEQGITQGYYPHWNIEGKEEEVVIVKKGKKFLLIKEDSNIVDSFPTRKGAEQYAMDNDLKIVEQFAY